MLSGLAFVVVRHSLGLFWALAQVLLLDVVALRVYASSVIRDECIDPVRYFYTYNNAYALVMVIVYTFNLNSN